MTLNATNILRGHVDEESAYVVTDYPYGFRLRTQIRYWIETTKHGDRFVSQTLNPKTGRWNKPKKSTYVKIAALYTIDEPGDKFGHVTWTGIGLYDKPEAVEQFIDVVGVDKLSESQKLRLAEIRGLARGMEGVTFTIHEGRRTPEEEAEQARVERVVQYRIARETESARAELKEEGQQ